MKDSVLSVFRDRAGIRSNRELSEMTGIKPRTMDRIMDNPRQARGHQLAVIMDVCGMSAEELCQIIKGGGA